MIQGPLASVREILRVRVMLDLYDGLTYAEIVRRLRTSPSTVARWRGRFTHRGIAGLKAIHPGKKPSQARMRYKMAPRKFRRNESLGSPPGPTIRTRQIDRPTHSQDPSVMVHFTSKKTLYRYRTMHLNDSFVRIPTTLLDTLIKSRLTGSQRLLLLWVIRQTYGWNRPLTAFTWYRVAKELELDRPTVYRSGKALLEARVLVRDGERIGVQAEYGLWDPRVFGAKSAGGGQLWIPGIDVGREQRKALAGTNAIGGRKQLKRWQAPTLFRRAKDSSKDILKTYKDRPQPKSDDVRHRHREERVIQRQPSAGAAKPDPHKYDGLSQN